MMIYEVEKDPHNRNKPLLHEQTVDTDGNPEQTMNLDTGLEPTTSFKTTNTSNSEKTTPPKTKSVILSMSLGIKCASLLTLLIPARRK